MKPYIIGLTGGIASGKTAVALVFETLGAKIIDADLVSRKVVEPGTKGNALLKEKFAIAFEDDLLNRRTLREIVFTSKKSRAALDEIMLPLIREDIDAQISELASDDVVVLVAPLLFESGIQDLTDIVVCVTANMETRLSRIISRDGVTAQLAVEMINAQLSDKERTKLSDVVIENNGDIKQLREKAQTVFNEIIERIH